MEQKIKAYQQILTDVLNEYADDFNRSLRGGVRTHVICDYQNNHYQLLRLGWDKGKYRFGVIFHFDIQDGKIWLQENRTDILIARELVQRGIPKEEIVLGLQPPEMRPFTEYAAA
jgi:XisI protein